MAFCPDAVDGADSAETRLSKKKEGARLECFSPLSQSHTHIKSSIIEFIRGFPASRVFFDVSEGNKFTQSLVGLSTLNLWLVHEGMFWKVSSFAALCLHAKTDENCFLDGV